MLILSNNEILLDIESYIEYNKETLANRITSELGIEVRHARNRHAINDSLDIKNSANKTNIVDK